MDHEDIWLDPDVVCKSEYCVAAFFALLLAGYARSQRRCCICQKRKPDPGLPVCARCHDTIRGLNDWPQLTRRP